MIKLTSTRDALSQGVKLLIHGAPGAGKTRLCATTGGSPVIISAEGGLLSLSGENIPVIEVSSISDVHEAYTFLTSSDEARAFDWVCLDSISEIAQVCLAHEMANTRDGRAAYGELATQMMALVRAFRDLPRNIYMSAQQERMVDEDTGLTQYAPSFPGRRLVASIPYQFDEVLAFRVERDAEGALQRWLQTSTDGTHVAKDRSGALDAFEPPNLAGIAAKIRAHFSASTTTTEAA